MLWLHSLPLVGILLFLALIASVEIGYRMAAWAMRRHNIETGRPFGTDQDYLLTAMLGLLTLLLGFTFSLALDRFEGRRDLVVKEANALDSAWRESQLLRAPDRAAISALLKQYVDARLRWSQSYAGRPGMEETEQLQYRLWAAAGAAARAESSLPIAQGLMQAVEQGFGVATARLAGRSAAIPNRVLNVLVLYVLLAVFMLGQVSASHGGLHRIPTALLLLLLTLALLLILDLDRTGEGSILVSQQPLADLRAAMR